jgi:hypothetical protein
LKPDKSTRFGEAPSYKLNAECVKTKQGNISLRQAG